MLAHHAAEPVPVGEPLALREVERVAEAVRDDRRARDAELEPGAREPPAELDVLPRHERRVEAVLEQGVAADDRRDQPEPALAAPRAVVVHERPSPVPRARLAEQPGLQRVVAVTLVLVDQVAQRAGMQHDVGVDQGDQRLRRRLPAHQAGGGQPLAFVVQDLRRVRAGDRDGAVARVPVHDDDLGGARLGDRREALLEDVLGVARGDDHRDGERGRRAGRRRPHRGEGPRLRHAPDPSPWRGAPR
jgi:hypothetical protein